MADDSVQNGETTDEFQKLIAENKRLPQELERNNTPNKLARPDLWAGKNNKIDSAIFVEEKEDGGPFSSTGACVRECVRECVRACVRACECVHVYVYACVCCCTTIACSRWNNTLPPHVCRKNLAVGGCACAHLGFLEEVVAFVHLLTTHVRHKQHRIAAARFCARCCFILFICSRKQHTRSARIQPRTDLISAAAVGETREEDRAVIFLRLEPVRAEVESGSSLILIRHPAASRTAMPFVRQVAKTQVDPCPQRGGVGAARLGGMNQRSGLANLSLRPASLASMTCRRACVPRPPMLKMLKMRMCIPPRANNKYIFYSPLMPR